MWRSQQLQPCCKQLLSLIQPALRLSEGGCSPSRCFQWLEQTLVKKRPTWEIFVSTLSDWFLCCDFFSGVCSRLLGQQPALIGRSFFYLFLNNSTDWGSSFAVKFCWRILKLLCLQFCVGDIDGILFSVVSPLCSECLKFASHLTKSLFHALIMALSFQTSVVPCCLQM